MPSIPSLPRRLTAIDIANNRNVLLSPSSSGAFGNGFTENADICYENRAQQLAEGQRRSFSGIFTHFNYFFYSPAFLLYTVCIAREQRDIQSKSLDGVYKTYSQPIIPKRNNTIKAAIKPLSLPAAGAFSSEIYEQDIFRLPKFRHSDEINEDIPEVSEDEEMDNQEEGQVLFAGLSLDGLGTTDETLPFSLRNTRPSSGFNNDRESGADSLFLSVVDGNIGMIENEIVSAWASDADIDKQKHSTADQNDGDLFLTTIADLFEAFPTK